MKTKHTNIRLDDETAAIIEKYQVQFGTKTSETIARLIKAADGAKFVTVISSTVSHGNQIAHLAGQLEKAKYFFREIKSRLNVPPPIDPGDASTMKLWNDQRQKIKQFYDECDTLWKFTHSVTGTMLGTTLQEIHEMQAAAALLTKWSDEYKKIIADSKNSNEKTTYSDAIHNFESVLTVLHRLGIEPTITAK
jgi:hypothetical protein